MNKSTLFFLLSTIGTVNMLAQAPAIWTNTYSGQSGRGLVLDQGETHVVIWGNAVDSVCLETAAALIEINASGTLSLDTTYELNYCQDELPMFFAASRNGNGYFYVTANDAVTPYDSSFLYFLDNNLSIIWGTYLGWNARSEITQLHGQQYLSLDDNGSSKRILQISSSGSVDTINFVTSPYFQVAPQRILGNNGLLYEIGNAVNADSAFVCLIYDTAGVFSSSFSFDADVTQTEHPAYAAINQNQIFHVSSTSSGAKTYPACSGLTGNLNWLDTLPYPVHAYSGVALDSINNVGYVLCDASMDHRLFSYNLNSGSIIDSLTIDSVDVIFTGLKSGPSGGVFLLYNKRFTDTILLDQYDAEFNLLWRGYSVHPTCTSACDPLDFTIDELGYVYTLSYCPCSGATLLVSKFEPSLVEISDNSPNLTVKIFPNPASSSVKIVCPNADGEATIQVFNSSGQRCYSSSFFGNACVINTEAMPSGIYLVEVVSGPNERYVQKLIIQHP